MNTNEFRHPKERLQNLSSRHKVSMTYLLAFLFIIYLFIFYCCCCPLSGSELPFRDLFPSMCVPVMCRLAAVQLAMQDLECRLSFHGSHPYFHHFL